MKPKKRLQNRQRKEICQYYMEHPNARQEDIAARWGVERSTVSKILKNKHHWMNIQDGEQHVTKHRPAKFENIELLMYPWLMECRESRSLISDAMIRAKAREVAREIGISDDKFKASAGWVENYKHRANIKKGVWIGKPDPDAYTPSEHTEDERDDVVFYYDLIEEKKRMEAEEQARREAEGSQQGMEGSRADLDSSSMALGNGSDWAPTLDLAFNENGTATSATGLDNHVAGLGGATGNKDVVPGQPSMPIENGNNLLQQHLASVRATWAGPGKSVVPGSSNNLPPVTAQEASSAMQTILRFLKDQQPDFLSEQERNILIDLKHFILVSAQQAASASAIAVPSSSTDRKSVV